MEGLEAAAEAAKSGPCGTGGLQAAGGRSPGPEQGPGGSGDPGDPGDRRLEARDAEGTESADRGTAGRLNRPSGPDCKESETVETVWKGPGKDSADAGCANGLGLCTGGTASPPGERVWGPEGGMGPGTAGATAGTGLGVFGGKTMGRVFGDKTELRCATSSSSDNGEDREYVEGRDVRGEAFSQALDQYRHAVLAFLQGQREILLSVSPESA